MALAQIAHSDELVRTSEEASGGIFSCGFTRKNTSAGMAEDGLQRRRVTPASKPASTAKEKALTN